MIADSKKSLDTEANQPAFERFLIEDELAWSFICHICGRWETEGFFVQIDYDKKELEILGKKGDDIAAPLLCGSCMKDSVAGVKEAFSRPLRDMPLMLHHENPFVWEVVRYRLKNES